MSGPVIPKRRLWFDRLGPYAVPTSPRKNFLTSFPPTPVHLLLPHPPRLQLCHSIAILPRLSWLSPPLPVLCCAFALASSCPPPPAPPSPPANNRGESLRRSTAPSAPPLRTPPTRSPISASTRARRALVRTRSSPTSWPVPWVWLPLSAPRLLFRVGSIRF